MVTEDPNQPPWWHDNDLRVSVAYQAVADGELTTANEVCAFFEKPYNYPELYHNWLEEQG